LTALPRRHAWRAGALLCGALALSAVPAGAQGGPPPGVGRRTAITVSGLPFNVTAITPADFDAGFVILGTMNFTVDATGNNPAFSPRVATVNLRCFAPCPATGTLAATGLQWRRGDLGTWNALTTTLTLVQSRPMTFNGANDPWSNTVQFRYLLSWATTAPAPVTQFQLEVQLVVTAP
jgi:hypothetical protein